MIQARSNQLFDLVNVSVFKHLIILVLIGWYTV